MWCPSGTAGAGVLGMPATFPATCFTCLHSLSLWAGWHPPCLSLHPCHHSELLAIRHCVFLMGPTGCGRSEVIRVLARAIAIGAQAPTNPYLQANNKKKVSGLGGGWWLG